MVCRKELTAFQKNSPALTPSHLRWPGCWIPDSAMGVGEEEGEGEGERKERKRERERETDLRLSRGLAGLAQWIED